MNGLNNRRSLKLLSNDGIALQIGGDGAVAAVIAQGEHMHQAGFQHATDLTAAPKRWHRMAGSAEFAQALLHRIPSFSAVVIRHRHVLKTNLDGLFSDLRWREAAVAAEAVAVEIQPRRTTCGINRVQNRSQWVLINRHGQPPAQREAGANGHRTEWMRP